MVTNPQFDWAQDPYWPTWFVDALDILGIRTKSAYTFTGPSARFQVTTVYRPCVSVSQSVTHKLVKKKVKGHDEIEDEEDVSTVDAVFSYDGRYFRHLVNPVTGAQLEPLETFIRLPRMSARFIVPPLSAAAAGGAKLTRHYLYNFTVQLRKGCDVGRSVAEFKDYTPWIERTRSRIRSVFDRTAGKFTKLGKDFQYISVAWMDIKKIPILIGPNTLVDFGELVSELQPMYPVPHTMLVAAQAMVQTSVPAEGMRETVAQRVIQEMKKDVALAAQVPGLSWSHWYLDDGALAGSVEALDAALRALEPQVEAVGLRLNRAKCKLWGPSGDLGSLGDDSPSALADIPWASWTAGVRVLDTPVGRASFVKADLATAAAKLELLLERLQTLACPQSASLLLLNCLGA